MKVFRIFDKVKRIFGTTEEAYRSLAYLVVVEFVWTTESSF